MILIDMALQPVPVWKLLKVPCWHDFYQFLLVKFKNLSYENV